MYWLTNLGIVTLPNCALARVKWKNVKDDLGIGVYIADVFWV